MPSNAETLQGNVAAPHRGAAPEPEHNIDLTGEQPDMTVMNPHTLTPAQPLANPQPPDGTPPVAPPAPQVQSIASPQPNPEAPQVANAPGPTNPAEAADLATYKQRYGEVVTAMGAQKEDFEAQMAQMRLDMEIALAGRPVALPPGQAAPAEINPQDTPTWEQIQQMNAGLPGVVTAAAIQAVWDVTQEEIQEVMSTNPNLQTLAEPQRTQLVHRAVKARRKNKAPNGAPGTTSPHAAQPTQAAPPQVQVPVENVVPHVEGSLAPPAFPEPKPGTALAAAQHEYEEAGKITNLKERNFARRKAWDKVLAAQGVRHEDLSKSGFQMT